MRKSIVIAMVMALTLSACGGSSDAAEPAPAPAPAATSRTEPAPLPPRDRTALATTTAVPEPVPEPRERPTHQPEARAELRVRRLVVTRGIEAREPVDAIDVLDRDEELERVYAFVDASNAGDGAGELEVTFERDDGFVTGMITLEVPARAARHRTWAFSRGVRTEGAWRAVVRDEGGRVLAEQAFSVE